MRPRNTTTSQLTLEALERQLKQRGFEPGAPPGIRKETLLVDRNVLGRMQCGHCGKQGLEQRPYRRGSSYAALGVCKRCGHAEPA